jgi:hypothetical protein
MAKEPWYLRGIVSSLTASLLASGTVLGFVAKWLTSLNDFERGAVYTLSGTFLLSSLALAITRYFKKTKDENTARDFALLQTPAPVLVTPPPIPQGFHVRSEELRGGANLLAPHLLCLELEIAPQIAGHSITFTCNGPIYRDACRFQQDGHDVGTTTAGPDTNSIILDVGGRGFAAPGVLMIELASISTLKLVRIATAPSFRSLPMPLNRGESTPAAKAITRHDNSRSHNLRIESFVANNLAYVLITNVGENAVTLYGILNVVAGIEKWPIGRVFAAWENGADPKATVEAGSVRRLIVGKGNPIDWGRWAVSFLEEGKKLDLITRPLSYKNNELPDGLTDLRVTIFLDSDKPIAIAAFQIQGSRATHEVTRLD